MDHQTVVDVDFFGIVLREDLAAVVVRGPQRIFGDVPAGHALQVVPVMHAAPEERSPGGRGTAGQRNSNT